MTSTISGPSLGAVLTTLDSLGSAPRSNWSSAPTVGNDFFQRFEEDLALFAYLGIRQVRLGIDWSRLQPTPGQVDDDWREWYLSVLLAAQRHGVGVWAALHEDTVPAWFDDEGSFADDRAAGLAWPRWVETAAELFGDHVAGWFPMVDPSGVAARWTSDSRKHELALINVAVAWRDSWRILRGGPPVATALRVRMIRPADQTVPALEASRFEDHVRWKLWLRGLRDGVVRLPNGNERVIADLGGALDVLGLVTSLDVPEGTITDDTRRRWEERLGTVLRRAAEEGPDRPISVAGLDIRWANTEECRLFVESTVQSLRATTQDGIPMQSVFIDPAIGPVAEPRTPHVASLVDRDRTTTGDTAAWLSLTPPASGSGSSER